MKLSKLFVFIIVCISAVIVCSISEANVYVANVSANTVSVIDSTKDKVIETISVGKAPVGVAVNPLNKRVYVSNRGDNTVSVIDSKTNKVIATIPVGKAPWIISVDEYRNRAYVNSSGDNLITVIDTKTNSVAGQVMTSGDGKGAKKGAISVSVNPGKGEAYATNCLTTSLSVINMDSNSVAEMVDIGRDPAKISKTIKGEGMVGVAVNTATGMVYTVDHTTSTVSVFDPAKKSITAKIPVGNNPWSAAVNPSLGKVYVMNRGDGSISVINADSHTIEDTIKTGSQPIAMTFVGYKGYVTNCGSNNVSVINLATNSQLGTIDLPGLTAESGLCPWGIAAF
jgi:YVTN family beta-propeller protein